MTLGVRGKNQAGEEHLNNNEDGGAAMVTRRGPEKVALGERPEGDKGTSHADIQREKHSWRREQQCKGSEARNMSRSQCGWSRVSKRRREGRSGSSVGSSQKVGGMRRKPRRNEKAQTVK